MSKSEHKGKKKVEVEGLDLFAELPDIPTDDVVYHDLGDDLIAASSNNKEKVDRIFTHPNANTISAIDLDHALLNAARNGNDGIFAAILEHPNAKKIKPSNLLGSRLILAVVRIDIKQFHKVLGSENANLIDKDYLWESLCKAAHHSSYMVTFLVAHNSIKHIEEARLKKLFADAVRGNGVRDIVGELLSHDNMIKIFLEYNNKNEISTKSLDTALGNVSDNNSERMLILLLQQKNANKINENTIGWALRHMANFDNRDGFNALLQHDNASKISEENLGWAIIGTSKHNNKDGFNALLQHSNANKITAEDLGWSLINAASNNNKDMFDALLGHNNANNIISTHLGKAFFHAVCHNNQDMINAILDHMNESQTVGQIIGAALVSAAFHNNQDVFNELLENDNADQIAAEQLGEALKHAVKHNNDDMFKALLEDHNNAHRIDYLGQCFSDAAYNNNTYMMNLLLERDSGYNITGNLAGRVLVHLARHNNQNMVNALLNHNNNYTNNNPNYCYDIGIETIGESLFYALSHNNEHMVKSLLGYHNDEDKNIMTILGSALFHATCSDNQDVFDKLLAYNNASEISGNYIKIALSMASMNDNQYMVKVLLDHNNAGEISASDLKRPLHSAARNNNQVIFDMLLEHDNANEIPKDVITKYSRRIITSEDEKKEVSEAIGEKDLSERKSGKDKGDVISEESIIFPPPEVAKAGKSISFSLPEVAVKDLSRNTKDTHGSEDEVGIRSEDSIVFSLEPIGGDSFEKKSDDSLNKPNSKVVPKGIDKAMVPEGGKNL